MTINYGTQTKITASAKLFKRLIPFWHAANQPEANSHFLVQNYCLEMDALKPTGGTALSIMSRVVIKIDPTDEAKEAANGNGSLDSGIKDQQLFAFNCFAVSLAVMVTGPSSCIAPS